MDTHILIVDDELPNRLILEDLLETQYFVHALSNGHQALDYLMAARPADLILLDVVMPGMDGFEVCRQIKAAPRLQDIPVMFLTSLDSVVDEEHGLSLGAADFIHKPYSRAIVLARIRNHLELAQARRRLCDRNLQLEHLVAERTREVLHEKEQVIAVQDVIITALCALAEIRDNETGNHIRRTQKYIQSLANKLSNHPRFMAELSNDIIQLLFKSAPLHDIGKVGIPDSILLKPGKLTDEEWVIMKRHTEYGRDAISQAEGEIGASTNFLRYARDIAYSHHEKWDGSGYPQGISGDAIPLAARLMAVADVYDALISARVYKSAYSHDEAVRMIVEERGTHFDPDIADALLEVEGEFRAIAMSYCDEEAGIRK
ncbi:HD domain-containing phosphohydrolase [Candidatus Symbiobacter mobilis]|uniref:Response regulator-like protein n=1 Tax=Candidatus Symbiobacter mobilis CR TaxID=946483 RepID=U5NCW5_9BURK|nr:HD domain-containing phosphohydrolase [Candidatus Symbiobacter mobilis]AGX88009.1 response regulator-like protein [Candidatus Symbiobacter mobilis CR]